MSRNATFFDNAAYRAQNDSLITNFNRAWYERDYKRAYDLVSQVVFFDLRHYRLPNTVSKHRNAASTGSIRPTPGDLHSIFEHIRSKAKCEYKLGRESMAVLTKQTGIDIAETLYREVSPQRVSEQTGDAKRLKNIKDSQKMTVGMLTIGIVGGALSILLLANEPYFHKKGFPGWMFYVAGFGILGGFLMTCAGMCLGAAVLMKTGVLSQASRIMDTHLRAMTQFDPSEGDNPRIANINLNDRPSCSETDGLLSHRSTTPVTVGEGYIIDSHGFTFDTDLKPYVLEHARQQESGGGVSMSFSNSEAEVMGRYTCSMTAFLDYSDNHTPSAPMTESADSEAGYAVLPSYGSIV